MDKTQLAKKIDQLASNVARKGVFVVTKKDDCFAVQEHITKKVVANGLPTKNVAEYLCDLRNKGKELGVNAKRNLQNLVEQYFKLKNDIVFYKNTMKTTKDNDLFYATQARLYDAISRLESVKYQLKKYR